MVMRKTLTISKLDAAKRQLEAAIRLYFSNGDPVPIHTLTAAAYNVTRDIGTRRGARPMLVKGRVLDRIKPEFRDKAGAKLNEAENFFKHGGPNPDGNLHFDPAISEVMILDACLQYTMLAGEEPPLFAIYRWWFVANHRDLVNLAEGEGLPSIVNFPALIQMGRASYFDVVLPPAMRSHT
jgi:hypothetical protein